MSPASQSTSSSPQGSWSLVMEGVESRAQLEGQDSQIMSENVERFQNSVKEIFKLIEQDENFSKMTPETYDSKKSKLTQMVTELSRMYGALADQNVHLIKEFSKNTDESTTPIKTQHVDSSTSTSPQVTTQGLESSFPIPSDSKSESPVKKDAILKVKETKVNEPKVLLKKISTLEKEQLSLKKRIQDLTDENAILGTENANVPQFKRMISEASRRMKAMVGVLEASRQQVITLDEENKMLKQELSSKVSEVTQRLQKQFDEQEARNLELHEKASSRLAVIAKRNEQITELNAQIELLKDSHAAEEDRLNADIISLKMELEEKCETFNDLNQKHDDLISCVDGLKLKVMEMNVCLHSLDLKV